MPFVARDKTYWSSFSDPDEAAYVTAFLNSEFLHRSIKDWMTTGLFGARDIHKRALDVAWPAFDRGSEEHLALATIAGNLGEVGTAAIRSMESGDVGRLRSKLREVFPEEELLEVERLVAAIAGSV